MDKLGTTIRQVEKAATEEVATLRQFPTEVAVAILGETPPCFEAEPASILLLVKNLVEERDFLREELEILEANQ